MATNTEIIDDAVGLVQIRDAQADPAYPPFREHGLRYVDGVIVRVAPAADGQAIIEVSSENRRSRCIVRDYSSADVLATSIEEARAEHGKPQ